MPQPNTAAGSLIGCLLALCLSPMALASEALEGLPRAVQDEISTICLPVQYRQGASAYRNCVLSEISLREGREDLLAELSFDDKYAVQQACAGAGRTSAAAFRACVTEQVAALRTQPEPDLSALSEDERYALQQSCFDAQSRQGALAYRQCMNSALQALAEIAPVDMSALSLLDRNAAQLRCSARTSSAADYRQCLAGQPGVTQLAVAAAPVQPATPVVVDDTVSPSTLEPQREPVAPSTPIAETSAETSAGTTADTTTEPPARPAAEPLAETAPEPLAQAAPEPLTQATADIAREPAIRPGPDASAQPATTVATDPLAANPPVADRDVATVPEPNVLAERLASAREMLVNAWQGSTWPARIAALGIPALLLTLIGWARARRRERQLQQSASGALTERLGRSMRIDRGELDELDELDQTASPMPHHAHRHDEAMPLFDDDDLAELDEALNLGTESDEPAIRREAALMAADDEATRFAEKPVARPVPAASPNDSAEADIDADPHDAPPAAPVRDFGPWLDRQSPDDRPRLCIELLIYWIAYADDRYDPALRRELFQARELDERDLIKRWAMQNDSVAFAEAIGHLQQHLDSTQKTQVLDLLMALLVTENAVTPVQNTLLRFLSDAFGIGRDALELRFQDAFGHPLGNMPRPDKEAWWKKQSADTRLLWDAHRVADLEQRSRLAARLGIDADSGEAEIVAAFRRAARRCHPDRFDALGERERALAASQFGKFEEARDLLLGVSV